MTLEWKTLLFLLPLLGIFLFFYRQVRQTPAILYSNIALIQKKGSSLSPNIPFLIALGVFSFAFIDLHFIEEQRIDSAPDLQEGPALFFLLDRSGSMREGGKMPLLKKITRDYLLSAERSQDAVGLVAFARNAQILSPLTFDHEAVVEKLETLTPVNRKQQDGTAIGHAIFKTVSLLSLMKGLNEPAVVVVTDGIQLPHPDDRGDRLRAMTIEEATQIAAQNGVRVYMISIDPQLSQKDFAPIRQAMVEASEKTGGKFFSVSNVREMGKVYEEMDSLAFSRLRKPTFVTVDFVRGFSFFPIFLIIGIASLFVGAMIETIWVRRIP